MVRPETKEQRAMRLLRGVVEKNRQLQKEIVALKAQSGNSAEVENLKAEASRVSGLLRGIRDAHALVETARALVRERSGAINLDQRLQEKEAELLKVKQQLEELSKGSSSNVVPTTEEAAGVGPDGPDLDKLAALGRVETKGEGRRQHPMRRPGGRLKGEVEDSEPQAT